MSRSDSSWSTAVAFVTILPPSMAISLGRELTRDGAYFLGICERRDYTEKEQKLTCRTNQDH